MKPRNASDRLAASRRSTAAPPPAHPAAGPPGLAQLLDWLRDDGWIGEDDAERVARASAPAAPACTRWCAWAAPACARRRRRARRWTPRPDRMAGRPRRLPYLRIDPLKADVGRVADVMSVQYAESAARCR
jgi:general secretion pathway protein E